MSEKNTYSFDQLKMFFGDDYKVADGIIISQPSIGDILAFGEEHFFEILTIFITNPTSFRVSLWKNGIDWNNISDYELFCNLILQPDLELDPEKTRLLFGNLDFRKFKPYKRKKNIEEEIVEDVVLLNEEQNVLIDEGIYTHMANYLRTMFNMFPKVEKAKGKTTKEWMIEEDIQNSKSKDKRSSTLLPMISFCLNHPGFKYKKNELRDLGIVEFNDSVQRLLIYESTSALMKGVYSGFVDTSKINNKEFNFMREFNS